MQEKDNPLKAAELATEQNYNMIDGVLNNMPPTPVPPEHDKPLDKVRELPAPGGAGSGTSGEPRPAAEKPTSARHGFP